MWEDDWFPHPHDSMPIATDKGAPEPAWERQDPPPELMEIPTSVRNPELPKKVKGDIPKTLHQKMYEMATKHHTTVGGSENLGGGSELIT